MNPDEEPELKPCGLCGGTDIAIRETFMPPVMNRPHSVISTEITHWCFSDGPTKSIHPKKMQIKQSKV